MGREGAGPREVDREAPAGGAEALEPTTDSPPAADADGASGILGCPTVDLGEPPMDVSLCNPPGGLDYFRDEIWPNYIMPGNATRGCTRAGNCHNEAGGRALGLEIGQLNRTFAYATGRTANQLTTLNAIDTLTPALTQTPDQIPVIPDPAGSAPLAQRARAYLHANCSYCHRPGGPTPAQMDWRYTTALNATGACDAAPTLGDLGIANARLIAPGDADRSVVVSRMNRTGANAMPPLGRHLVDTAGVQLIREWVGSLTGCN